MDDYEDGALIGPGPYDADPPPETDLWFLPGPGDPMVDTVRSPGGWPAAQAANAVALADLAGHLGALDERLRHVPGGAARLALSEAAGLSWWAGDRVAPERLAAAELGHLSGTGDDAQALARAGWALRRLSGGPDPRDDLPAFLDRRGQDSAGSETVLPPIRGLHPIVAAARVFAQAQARGGGPAGAIEAAVLAARLGGGGSRGAGLPFLPLAAGGAAALTAGGPPAERLPRWIAGAAGATLAALMDLDRLAAWRRRAAEATGGMSGRTPTRLIAALAAAPVLGAPAAEAATGASRAAVQRNLARLVSLGLVREITGQGRYRLWRAVV